MRVVLLGNITEADNGVSLNTNKGYSVDITYVVKGYIMNISEQTTGGWHSPMTNIRSNNPVERLPWVSPQMFVLYDDYFSETPTQSELDNFDMVHGFTPSLIEL